MGASDLVTAAAMQLWSMQERGVDEGVLLATVTVPVNRTDGEVSQACFVEARSFFASEHSVAGRSPKWLFKPSQANSARVRFTPYAVVLPPRRQSGLRFSRSVQIHATPAHCSDGVIGTVRHELNYLDPLC